MTESKDEHKEKNPKKSDIVNYDKIVDLYEKRFKVQEQTLSTIIKTIVGLKVDSPSEIKVLWNIAGFVNIISYDIKVITRDMILAQDEWLKRHYARQACLIIYESINDLFELLGKDFRRILRAIQIDDLHLEFKAFRSDLNLFKDKYHKKLYTIRNMSIAHRDKQVLKQLSSIIQIDSNEILSITFEFEGILQNLEDFLQKFHKEVMKIIEKDGELEKE
jgi:hypothetical protein